MFLNNSLLKSFIFAGIPIISFFSIFFSLLVGIKEGLIPGLITGFLLGIPISLFLGLFYSKPVQKEIKDISMKMKSRPKQKIKQIVFLPLVIVFGGACLSRFYGHIISFLILSVFLSIVALAITPFLLLAKDFKQSVQEIRQEIGIIGYLAFTFSQIIPLSILFATLVFMFYGFNFTKIKDFIRF